MSKLADANAKLAEGVVKGYKKIESSIVSGYQRIEEGVTEGFGRVTDKCVEVLFAREGENAAEAKKRLSGKNNSIERGNDDGK